MLSLKKKTRYFDDTSLITFHSDMVKVIKKIWKVFKYLGLKEFVVSTVYILKGAWRKKMGHRYVQRKIFEFDMLLDLEDLGISKALLRYGRRELEHLEVLKRVIKPDMTIFDIGANVGYYVLIEAALMKGSGKIVAIEPAPSSIENLRKNLAINSLTNVEVISGAVSDVHGVKNLFLSNKSNWHTLEEVRQSPAQSSFSGECIPVETFTVSDVVKNHGLPDLIRMDVEGHEVEILKSLLDVDDIQAGSFAPMILFESHGNYDSSEHNLAVSLRALFKLGYKVRYLGSIDERGAEFINNMGYEGSEIIAVGPGRERVLYEYIEPEDAIDLIYNAQTRTVFLCNEG